MNIGDDGLLPLDPDPRLHGIDHAGFNNNWWLGLSLLHTLFVKEHNAICDALKRTYSGWSNDQLFDKARMINAALIGKIHTVEWTPAILANPVLEQSMNIVWSGLEDGYAPGDLAVGVGDPARRPRLAAGAPRGPVHEHRRVCGRV